MPRPCSVFSFFLTCIKELLIAKKKKGPGLSFRKGLSLPDIIKLFPDEKAAEAWFAQCRWPHGPQCPRCGSWRIQSGTAHKTMPYRCRECRRWFSVRTKTVMAESKLGYQVWILAIYLLTTGIKGTSSMKLRHLGKLRLNPNLARPIRRPSGWRYRGNSSESQDSIPASDCRGCQFGVGSTWSIPPSDCDLTL